MSRYLEFEEEENGKITVISKRQKTPLGTIEFYGAWKQHVFCPISNALFNDESLEDIVQVVQDKNREES